MKLPKNIDEWFSAKNYNCFTKFSNDQLDFEIKKRNQLIKETELAIQGLKEAGSPEPGTEIFESNNFRFKHVFEGRPSFYRHFEIIERRKTDELTDLDSEETLDYLLSYHSARYHNSLEKSLGVKLLNKDSHSELERACNHVEQQLREHHGAKERQRHKIEALFRIATIPELPVFDGNDDETWNYFGNTQDIPLEINIKEFTNKELVEGFKQVIEKMRDFHDIPEPIRGPEKKRKLKQEKEKDRDRHNVIKYRVLQWADIHLWCVLSGFTRRPETKILDALYEGTTFDKRTQSDTKQIWEKVRQEHYCLAYVEEEKKGDLL